MLLRRRNERLERFCCGYFDVDFSIFEVIFFGIEMNVGVEFL